MVLICASTSLAATRVNLEKKARTACLSGDYANGVAILAELFVESEDPAYIYNQGRCFEQNARYEDAITRFQEYLRIGGGLPRRDREEARRHIRDCEALLAKRTPALTVPGAVPSVPEPSTALGSSAVAADASAGKGDGISPVPAGNPVSSTTVVLPLPSSPSSSSAGALRTAGMVVGAFGATGMLAGLVLNLKVNGMTRELESKNGYSEGKESDRQKFEALGWVGYGLGAGCLVTGAVLYYLGHRDGNRERLPVAVAPTLVNGSPALGVAGGF